MDSLLSLLAKFKIDFSPRERPPRLARWLLGTFVVLVGSLVADALIAKVGVKIFPKYTGYPHFQFMDYAKLTVIGVLGACIGWPIVTMISSAPRWVYFRLAVIVTLVLFLPDVYILYLGQPAVAVGILIVMHIAIALVTYNAMIHLAPTRHARHLQRHHDHETVAN
jgi:hypothetical protein